MRTAVRELVSGLKRRPRTEDLPGKPSWATQARNYMSRGRARFRRAEVESEAAEGKDGLTSSCYQTYE